MRNERAGNTLQATALVNEVYLRLVDVKQDRTAGLAIRQSLAAARTGRRALTAAARHRRTASPHAVC